MDAVMKVYIVFCKNPIDIEAKPP